MSKAVLNRIAESTLARRLAGIILAVIASVVVAVSFAVIFLDLPKKDAGLLIELLLISAIISLTSAGLFIWISQERSWNRLVTRMLGAHVVGILVVLINVAVTATAMMLSTHDLSLLGLLLGYSVAIAAIYSALVSAWIGDSLQVFQQAARKMAAGDLTARVPETGERELSELAVAFNTMAARLESSFKRQQDLEEARQGLIAAVSHDLRTPIASLRVMVESISDGIARDPATVQRYMRAIERETVNLGHLVDDLFEMARLDAGQISLHLEPSPMGALVMNTLDGMHAQARQRGVALLSEIDWNAAPAMADPDQIQRVLYNLVQNAIRHTPADGSVIVGVQESGLDIVINVRDTGEGIDAEDLPYVFDQFYRRDKARSRDRGGGAGLGLAISKRLVETHGGRIWVRQPLEGGSIFTFTLPKALLTTTGYA